MIKEYFIQPFSSAFSYVISIFSSLVKVIDFSSPLTLNLISGLIGSMIGAIFTSIVSYFIAIKSIKSEKRYYIELEIIPEKLLNPLFEQYKNIKKMQERNINENISNEIYENINSIFEKNTCWYFVANKKLKKIFNEIRDSSKSKIQVKLIQNLETLDTFVEKTYAKKYK